MYNSPEPTLVASYVARLCPPCSSQNRSVWLGQANAQVKVSREIPRVPRESEQRYGVHVPSLASRLRIHQCPALVWGVAARAKVT